MNVLACGALAHELVALKAANAWTSMNITCLPAHYHQTPSKIAPAVKLAIEKIRTQNSEDILVAYGDCGTAGALDKVLEEAGVARLPGAHCYAFFAGGTKFDQLQEAEVGTFYLTDFLVDHFDVFVWQMLGLDKQPELLELYFGNYTKLIFLAQTESDSRQKAARQHAATLGLRYEYHFTEYGEMGSELHRVMSQSVSVPCPV